MRSKIQEITAGKSGKIYQQCVNVVSYKTPCQFVKDLYAEYERRRDENNAGINGRVFEYAVCETLACENITPFYYQAKFQLVPNAEFDIVLYNDTKPVVLTLKVSLRERYKQSDLEGLALRHVYRGAKSFLITLSENEAPLVKSKISKGDISGLDDCMLANTKEFDDLIKYLSGRKFQKAEYVMPISGRIYAPPANND